MYRNLEIVTQQEPATVSITKTHYDVCLMRFSSVRRGTLSGRVTVKGSISCYDTETRYGCYGAGQEREVSQDARWRSACTELVRVLLTVSIDVSLESFYCDVSFGLLLL